MKSYGTCLSQSDSFHLADILPCLSIHVVTSGSTYLYVCVHTTHLPYPFVYGWTQVLSVWLLEKKKNLTLLTSSGMRAPPGVWVPVQVLELKETLGRAWLRRRKAAGSSLLSPVASRGVEGKGTPPPSPHCSALRWILTEKPEWGLDCKSGGDV